MGKDSTNPGTYALPFEESLHHLFDHAPQPQVAVREPHHTVCYVNPAFAALVGRSASELIGLRFDQAVPECEAARCTDLIDRVCRTGEPQTLSEQEQPGSAVAYWSFVAWPVLSPAGALSGVLIQVQDVTEHTAFRRDVTSMNESLIISAARQHELTESAEHLNAHLRELNNLLETRTRDIERQSQLLRELNISLARAEQRERKHLAEVLHDGMQQVLVAVKLRLETARQRLKPKDRKSLDEIGAMLGQCIAVSRTLAIELFPPALHYGGLLPGLRWLAAHMQEKQGLAVDLRLDEEAEPAADDMRTLVFQAAREMLFNVVKHAGVMRCTLTLHRNDGALHLSVSDLGQGFEPAATASTLADTDPPLRASTRLTATDGFGTSSIRNRVEAQGGSLVIQTAPGHGTHVTLTIPEPT